MSTTTTSQLPAHCTNCVNAPICFLPGDWNPKAAWCKNCNECRHHGCGDPIAFRLEFPSSPVTVIKDVCARHRESEYPAFRYKYVNSVNDVPTMKITYDEKIEIVATYENIRTCGVPPSWGTKKSGSIHLTDENGQKVIWQGTFAANIIDSEGACILAQQGTCPPVDEETFKQRVLPAWRAVEKHFGDRDSMWTGELRRVPMVVTSDQPEGQVDTSRLPRLEFEMIEKEVMTGYENVLISVPEHWKEEASILDRNNVSVEWEQEWSYAPRGVGENGDDENTYLAWEKPFSCTVAEWNQYVLPGCRALKAHFTARDERRKPREVVKPGKMEMEI